MAAELHSQNIGAFLDTLASKAPSPGGGSVAGLNGALAASLVSMVCAIIEGRKKPPPDPESIHRIHIQAETLRYDFLRLADEDSAVFGRLTLAYHLPRTTDADAASRRVAIQQMTRLAADVPLRTAHAALGLLPLCRDLLPVAGRLLVSDIGVAATLVRAAVHSSLLNVEINLTGLEDQNYVRGVRSQLADLSSGLDEDVQEIMQITRERMQP